MHKRPRLKFYRRNRNFDFYKFAAVDLVSNKLYYFNENSSIYVGVFNTNDYQECEFSILEKIIFNVDINRILK